jgi:hypothetical protein
MADIRCTSCGKNNPDFLGHCQFCQSPLKPESVLRAGESPTKKNTGELKPVLPQWLQDVQEQARQSAEESAAYEKARPRPQSDEPPDLLAGLASQTGADDDVLPDWLASINPVPGKPAEEPESTPAQEDQPPVAQAEERDELSQWFSQASQDTSEPFILEPGQEESDWMNRRDPTSDSLRGTAPPKEEEDLSWLHELEASAKRSSEPTPSQQDFGRRAENIPSQPSSEEDLSWLSNLGGMPEPVEPKAADESSSAEPSTPQEDLSWLDKLGKTEPLPSTSPAAQEDLSWLDNLGHTSELSQPETPQPAPQEDLDWLSDLGEKTGAVESEEQILSPRGTAPLGTDAPGEAIPDWLKSATEEPSMPPLGASGLDWLASHEQDVDQPAVAQEPAVPSLDASQEPSALPPEHAEEVPSFTPSSEPLPASNQDVDALFSVDVPDWLSQPEPESSRTPLREAETSPGIDAESLAPVDLPSWVQAMRPVEAVISDTASRTQDQILEKEGPLAGLSGVIPLLPIGSSRKPKALSLTLQTTDEQQAGAALLEQVLARETTPQPVVKQSSVMSQNILRWILAALVILVLGAMIGLGSQSMPVSSALPVEVGAASNAIASLPQNTPVLVIIDYEPAQAAEMEAVGGPVLNQIVSSRGSEIAFLSTSPNGPALVRRLLTNTGINVESDQSTNLGYLPGGSAGVLAFIESPRTAVPAAEASNFSEYAAVLMLTSHAESARAWVEQLDARRQSDASLASQPLVIVSSAQTGPMLQPYVESRQVTGLVSGLPDAARYEASNNIPPGIARTYWDAFGIGLLLAILLIMFGSLWSLVTRLSPRRPGVE